MKPIAQQSLYELLEVAPDSPAQEIEAAYARARELYAPGSIVTYSLMSPEDAELLAVRLEEARATLLDPAARAAYDARLDAQAERAPAPWPSTLPPIIPALALAPAAPEEEDEEGEVGGASAAPAGPERTAAGASSSEPAPPEAPRSPPAAAPIRLEREVSPTRTPVPARTPVPLSRPYVPAAPAREVAVPEGTSWSGEMLRQLREARGISIQQISERTKVTRHHIENIEADRYAQLPAPVYLRGILLGIARELRLDGQKVARSYLERMTAAAASGARR